MEELTIKKNTIPTIIQIIIVFCLVFFLQESLHSQSIAVLEYKNIKCKIENEKLKCYYENKIKINSRNGEKYSKIRIPYEEDNKINNLKASLIDKDGNVIRDLKKKEIVYKSSISRGSLYEDDFVAEFTLRNNNYPFYIQYSYNQNYSSFLSIVYTSIALDINIPTNSFNVEVSHPKDYKLFHFHHGLNYSENISPEGMMVQTWNGSYDGKYDDEIFPPDLSSYIPRLVVYPENIYYEKAGSFSTWGDFGNWVCNLNEGSNDLPAMEKIIVNDLTSGFATNRLKMKILYEYVQERTRYINVSIETGGFKPYPASYVSENKYGDCKALSIYYKALLEAAGIPSFYCLINAGEIIKAIDREHAFSQFNHAIICAIDNYDTIWIDCTSNNPFQYSGTFIQGREVFVVAKDSSFFSFVPALKPDEVQCSRNAEIALSVAKTSRVKIREIMKGYKFEMLKYILENYGKKDLDEFIIDYIVPGNLDLVEYSIQEFTKNDKEIKIDILAESSSIVKKYGNDLLVKTLSFSVPDFEKPQYRGLPVKINYPIYKSDSIIYLGVDTEKLAGEYPVIEINSKWGKYTNRMEVKDSKIILYKSFILNSGSINLESYPEFHSFISEIQNTEKKTSFIIEKY